MSKSSMKGGTVSTKATYAAPAGFGPQQVLALVLVLGWLAYMGERVNF